MKLTIEAALRGVAHSLSEQIMPGLQDPFAIEAARLAAILATIAANTADDAVAVRVTEHASIRNLFADAAKIVSDRELSIRLVDESMSGDPGLKLSVLDGETGRLRRLLVELHAHVEMQADDIARALDARIWELLARIEMARAPRG